jgi:uncharacterized protein YaaN involved in tellurite resistance
MTGLKTGAGILERNNVSLKQEKQKERNNVEQLKKAIAFGQLLDDKIEQAIMDSEDAEWKQILSEEILFPLRQRISTLQKTRVIKNQSILTYEMIIRTNRQLINCIKNSDQSIAILKNAIIIMFALKDAENINKAVTALDEFDGNTLVSNSEKLKTTVTAAYKSAARAGIPMGKLVTAQQNLLTALTDISSFIQEQLPIMKEEANQAEAMNKEVEAANERMDRGSKIGEKIAESMKDLF